MIQIGQDAGSLLHRLSLLWNGKVVQRMEGLGFVHRELNRVILTPIKKYLPNAF